MKRTQRFHCEKVRLFKQFINEGIQHLNRSEIATYLTLYGHMKDTGFSRTARSEIARIGGMSKAQASRALQSLIDRGAIRRVCDGYPGKASLYTLFDLGELVKFSPAAKAMLAELAQKRGANMRPEGVQICD